VTRARPVRLFAVAGVAVLAVGVLAAAGLDGALVYYRTPVEAVAAPVTDERVRVGGLVVDGSLDRSGETVTFEITDGVADVTVVHVGTLPAIFREGQGAVVEGRFTADGVLRSDTVLVRHSNEYGPEPATTGTGAP
jgi:cytochrome c-type biogenesis protein CcmE